MLKNQWIKIIGLSLVFLLMVINAGCEDLGKSAANLIYGKYEVPTTYVLPLAQGTNYLLLTSYPQGTPAYNQESCRTMVGETFLIEVQVQYHLFQVLRGTTGGTSRKDIPPTIDEMRKLHDEVLALEPPADCEMFVELQYHMGAEIDQTIRALVSFRNSEPDDVMLDYFNESFAHKAIVEDILYRVQ